MMPGSFHGTRTIGVTGWPCIAWKHCIIDWYSCTPCCMSTVTLSKPHCAITSAEKPEGIASQAFTTALPEAQTFLTLFATLFPSLCLTRRHCEPPGRADVRPLACNDGANRPLTRSVLTSLPL